MNRSKRMCRLLSDDRMENDHLEGREHAYNRGNLSADERASQLQISITSNEAPGARESPATQMLNSHQTFQK